MPREPRRELCEKESFGHSRVDDAGAGIEPGTHAVAADDRLTETVNGSGRKVIKMRGGNHSKDVREYVISEKGMVVIHPRRTDYYGLITGIPQRTGPRKVGGG